MKLVKILSEGQTLREGTNAGLVAQDTYGPLGSARPHEPARLARYAHRNRTPLQWPGADSRGKAKSTPTSPPRPPSAADRTACLSWPQRSAHRCYSDNAVPYGGARWIMTELLLWAHRQPPLMQMRNYILRIYFGPTPFSTVFITHHG